MAAKHAAKQRMQAGQDSIATTAVNVARAQTAEQHHSHEPRLQRLEGSQRRMGRDQGTKLLPRHGHSTYLYVACPGTRTPLLACRPSKPAATREYCAAGAGEPVAGCCAAQRQARTTAARRGRRAQRGPCRRMRTERRVRARDLRAEPGGSGDSAMNAVSGGVEITRPGR